MSDAVLTEVRGQVGLVTLNRPEKRNPMSLEMIDALPPALAGLAAKEDVRAIVITGAGRSFSAGADFTAMAGLVARTGRSGPAATRDAVRALYDAFLA
ncbi:MAG: enoyl-CoA hydratase/isomerase family protein, partial [Myxococcales bacterium]|nr:enoyl-CoA hydratase/isomerase family protein [Myxococcales bacterium]